ncbi:hypothetical protein FSST1_009948 [Fusarium sambucinum]
MSPSGQEPRSVEVNAPAPTSTNKRARAKRACRECNARRVRCNVTDSHPNPCYNCKAAGISCEVMPSRRGRYKRRNKTQKQSDSTRLAAASPTVQEQDEASPSSPRQTSLAPTINSVASSLQNNNNDSDSRITARTPSPATDSTAQPTLFFGESNFLTLVPDGACSKEQPDIQHGQSKQKSRLLFPINQTPQSLPEGESPANIEHLSAGTSRYLRDEGALTLPNLHACTPALQAYFTWFHPCFPILDREEFTRKVAESQVSYILLQSMLFIGATYCDNATITSMGFSDRTEAKSLLYRRARLLFHADWEKDQITLIQSLFLMSFWRGGPSDVRDVRYWLGVVIGIAESYGLHRSTRFATRDPRKARIRKRIWWSIYVRERQASASLGLPSRIRDEDCDVEPLSSSDLESEVGALEHSPFGSCQQEHVTYAVSMVNLARILGQVIDLHFAPGKQACTPEQLREVDDTLQKWKASLPKQMDRGVEDGTASVWGHLLHLAYNHVRILIYRHKFVKQDHSDDTGHIAATAASKISRIAEDMLIQGTLRYGQMHSITSLFAALCIHAISIRRSNNVSQRIAESRAQMCLLGLQEIQKYWRINNNVLDLFLQYLDVSIARRLKGQHPAPDVVHATTGPSSEEQQHGNNEMNVGEVPFDFPTPFTQDQSRAFEDQYIKMLYGPWDGGGGPDFGATFDVDNDSLQLESFNILGRSL